MTGGKTRSRVLSVLAGAGMVVLLALLAACGSSGGGPSYQLDGVVQAVDGQQVVLTLVDGSKVRLDAEKQADDARKMIGEEVKCKIQAGEDMPKLVEINKVAAPTSMPGLQVMPEDFHFTGVVESMGVDSIVISGKTFKVNAATILDQGLVPGVIAEVEFIMLADGALLATEVETGAPDEAAAQAQPAAGTAEDYTLTGVIGSITANELMLGGKTFKIDAVTVLDQGLKPGVMARVEFVVQADRSLLALEVETDAPEVAEAMQEDFTANGPIQSIDSGSVTVDGRKFIIDANTGLDQGLAPGVLVEIEFVIKPDGSMLAKQVETSGIDEGVNLYFAGPIQSMSATAWVVGGKTFVVDAATQLDQGLGVGINANVEFVARPDGSFLAVHIENTGFKFVGMVQAIAPNAYTIGGRVFMTNANTLVDQGLKVRKLAQVSFLIRPDGSLLALEIKTPKTKVAGFTFKGVVQSLSAASMVATGETFEITPATVFGAGVATGAEVSVVFDVKPGNILSALSVQNAKAARK